MGATPEGQKRLVAIYIGLARDLEERLKQAPPEIKRSLSKGFEAFLRQLSSGSREPNVLNWVGETFLSLGAGSAQPGSLTDESKSYYGQAAAAFQKILEQPDLEASLQTRIRLRQAEALRRTHEYQPALDLLELILRENPLLVNVQAEAARTYQDWAAQPGEASRYERAMHGSGPDPQTKRRVFLGWEGIANMAASSPKFRDAFHEARYNLALCRLSWAESKSGAERNQLLEKAARDISLTFQLYGLGDEKTSRQYDALLKRIQKAQGKQPVGIAALKPKKPTAPAAKPGN